MNWCVSKKPPPSIAHKTTYVVYKQEANYSNSFQEVQGYTSTHLLKLPELDKICSLLYAAEHPYAKQPKSKVIKNLELLSFIRML